MKYSKKLLVILVMLTTSVGLLGGCGENLPKPKEQNESIVEQKEEPTKQDNQGEKASEVTEEANKEVLEGEITIALPAGNFVEFMDKQIIPYFEAEYPNVEVQVVTDENIDTKIAAGDSPNIMMGVFGYMPAKYSKLGMLVDYKQIDGYEEVFDKISEEFIVENFNGLYYVPWSATTQMMIYNKDLFREAGLDPNDPPTTFEEYLVVAQKISALPDRENGSKVYGSVMWNDALSWGGWYWTMISQIYYNFNDGQFQLFNEYGTDVVVDNEDANMGEFFKFLQQVQDTAPPTMEKNFFSRNIGMWLQYGYGWKNNLKEAAGQPMVIGEDVGLAPIPTMTKDGKHWSTLDGRAAMIFKTSPEEETISWEFVKFLMRDEYNLEACKYLGQLPTLKSLKGDPYFNLPENKPFVDQLANALPNEPVAELDQVANLILNVYPEVIIEKSLTPDEAVKKIAEESRRIIE